MYRPDFSAAQNFAANLIEHVGCISLYQMQYILHRRYEATPSETAWCMRDFEGEGICHFDKNDKVIVAGKSVKDELHKFERNTIIALSVALNIIEDPTDYRTIYNPQYGEDLIFMNGDQRYGVIVNREDSVSNILHYQRIFNDQKLAAQQNKIDMEMFEDSYSELLITYPLKADKVAAFKNVEALDLTMPHSLCFVSGSSIYGELKLKKIEATA